MVMAVFVSAGIFQMSFPDLLLKLALIAMASTVVEAISPEDTDNITVPVISVLLGFLLF